MRTTLETVVDFFRNSEKSTFPNFRGVDRVFFTQGRRGLNHIETIILLHGVGGGLFAVYAVRIMPYHFTQYPARNNNMLDILF